MVFQWSDEFNAEHVVERYNVRVSPDPASCTSDQVPSRQNYSCSGLDQMDTIYSVSITAFNCINQEGEDATYDIQPQLLGMINCMWHCACCAFTNTMQGCRQHNYFKLTMYVLKMLN